MPNPAGCILCPSGPAGADAVTQREKSEADREAAWSKTLKTVSWPEMDDDALPSTYCGKVMNCLGKWQLKISDMAKSFDQFSELDEFLEQLLGEIANTFNQTLSNTWCWTIGVIGKELVQICLLSFFAPKA